ncbi:MAG: rhomboid family intramembrane serine protease [Pseudomonadota bacterium]
MPGRQAAPVWALIIICTVIEAALWLGELTGLGPGRLRQSAYEYAGFWPGLRAGWQPNYPGQPWAMFLSYGFLHGGAGHLVVNMITLWSLGRGVVERVGPWGFLALYAASILGGALGFALLAETFQPMVGASGALFGLAGGLMAWAYVDRFTARVGLWPVARVALFLVAINVAMYWALDGQLAWQTHLGGFVIGWIAALLIDPRPAAPLE